MKEIINHRCCTVPVCWAEFPDASLKHPLISINGGGNNAWNVREISLSRRES
jgi:hypothetical protein